MQVRSSVWHAVVFVGMLELHMMYTSFAPGFPAVGHETTCQSENEAVNWRLAYLLIRWTENAYYIYYASHVMNRMDDPARREWYRLLSRTLCESQAKGGCAEGSWDPDKPTEDIWGERAGRLYTTSLSALALESYYRYLLLDKHESPTPVGPDDKQ